MMAKVSKIFGKEVFTLSGARVGRIADVAIDVNTRSVSDIFISNLDSDFSKKHGTEGNRGIIFTYKGIRSIQDIVVINDVKPLETEVEQAQTDRAEQLRGIIEE